MNPDIPGDSNFDGGNRIQDGAIYTDEQPGEAAYRKLKLISLFQFTYVGAPMLYYGTEVGMYGADDPMCRFPMWWEDLAPYDDPGYVIRKDLFREFQGLASLRKSNPVLSRGDFHTLMAGDGDVYAFLRNDSQGNAIVVVLNNAKSPTSVTIDPSGLAVYSDGFQKANKLHGDGEVNLGEGRLQVSLEPVSGVVIDVAE